MYNVVHFRGAEANNRPGKGAPVGLLRRLDRGISLV